MTTIFALATAQGRAGVAVVRISGPDAVAACADLCGSVPDQRGVRRLLDADGVLLDEALVLNFPSGQSFTGESVVELHLHGSPAVIAAVLRVLSNDTRLQAAEAGEFTRRALENGKLDLTQVEGLADLIDAETESQRKQAIRVLSGALGEKASGWRTKLIRAAALVEATIDFADEDVPVDVYPEVHDLIDAVAVELQSEAAGVQIAERVREGFEVAIVGPPNAGKSTLLNRLAGRDAAITSEIAGTTRDVIEVRMDLAGLPVTMLDTAGLRDTDDEIEKIGVQRAKDRAEQADLRIYLQDGGITPELHLQDDDIVVTSKSDMGVAGPFAVSGKTGDGVDRLIDEVSAVLKGRTGQIGVAMRERHRVAMLRAIDYIQRAKAGMAQDTGLSDLIAEDLRSATRAIDALIGRVDVEQVLDEIFMSFCIGK
ncbi:tRNA uridine-5-carboxymethylaminomethyl(34) synthesis GTPase MnmE [Yoonia sp. 208BN28-4]|uniref:tRNA uridine-5-carboxymethylaminomethyl(34) synthesis GTPase MnmE n=1 Tax=Yoonia sp. 208BN28-4 TaxID=3126505 RepID=UPI0030A29B62